MSRDFRSKAKSCCRLEKERVSSELERCNSGDSAFRHRCYRSVARKSGERSRRCMLS